VTEELHENPEYPKELPYRRVLDRGFVALVDVMGDDASIVQAARVSYGKGTKTVRSDKALISYLMRHRHTTPWEMIEFKFLMRLPVFIARQVIRHRTACLAGNTVLSFDLPGAGKRGRRCHFPRTIAVLHRLWNQGTAPALGGAKRKLTHLDRVDPGRTYTIPELARLVDRHEDNLRAMVRRGYLDAERDSERIRVRGAAWHAWAQRHTKRRVPIRERLRRMKLRMCDERSGEIAHTCVSDIWETGIRPVFRVTLENGYQVKMTKDHRCLTELGWMTLEQATNLRLRADGGVTWSCEAPALAVNGVPRHRSREWLSAQRAAGASVSEMADRAGVSYHTIRKALRQNRLQFTSPERSRLSGRAQRGQKRTLRPRVYTEKWLRRIREARSGPRSNFWKGGVTTERANIGRWTREHAARVHARNGFRCVLCGSKDSLHTHHIDPVWNNAEAARDESKLTSLCRRCHSDLHRLDLEIELLRSWESGQSLADFWNRHPGKGVRPERKRKPGVRRLFRGWSRISRVEYAGEEMTYDLEVTGPFHNFVANGFIVHNSVNEYSARYSIVPDRFWVPDLGAIAEQDEVNRQGRADLLHDLADAAPERKEPCAFAPPARAVLVREGKGISRGALGDPSHRSVFLGGDALPTESYVRCAELLLDLFPDRRAKLERVRDTYRENNERCYGLYQKLIEGGVAREIARSVLPPSMYPERYWKIALHNLLHFLKIRMHPNAQLEVRAYGEAMGAFVKERVPLAWDAFENDNLLGTFLSRDEKEVMRPEGHDAQIAALRALFERGYRRRRLKEVCRKLEIDERLVDEVDPPAEAGA